MGCWILTLELVEIIPFGDDKVLSYRMQYMIWLRKQYTVLPPVARALGSRNQGVEVGMVPLSILPNNSLAEFLLPVSSVLCFLDWRSWFPTENSSIRAYNVVLLNLSLRLLPGHLELFLPWNQWARNQWDMIIHSDNQGKLGAGRDYICAQESSGVGLRTSMLNRKY